MKVSGSDPTQGAARVLRVGQTAAILLTLVIVALLARVLQLQTRPSASLAELLDSQRSSMKLMGRRGALLDRRGRPLAVTRVAHRLFVDPGLIHDRGSFSEQVAYRLNYDPVWVEKTIAARSSKRYVVLDHRAV